jgi:hypothetical protein
LPPIRIHDVTAKLVPLIVLLLLSPAALAEPVEAPAPVPENPPALERIERIHQTLVVLAKRRVHAESGGTPEQRAFQLARLDGMRVAVEDNALCGDEGYPLHYSEINNQLLVCPRTADAPRPELARALARGLALSLSPCHADGWVLKPGVVEKLEGGDSSPLAACPGGEEDHHAIANSLLQAVHGGQAAFPQTMDWTTALKECKVLDHSPYHPLDGHDRFIEVPFGSRVAEALDAMPPRAILELLLDAKDKPASIWNWPACQEEALDAFARLLAEELLQ